MSHRSPFPPKDPAEVLDYTFDWGRWLDGDTIDTVSFTTDAGLTEDSNSFTDSTATCWVSGGTAGERYLLTCTIETAGGRTGERSRWIRVKEL